MLQFDAIPKFTPILYKHDPSSTSLIHVEILIKEVLVNKIREKSVLSLQASAL